ncbi:MAG: DUF1080 domain-containing protein [Kordiimonadaceae bacterium]|jgi:type 1 glutamine amidotransferase|nr:DUF1080 domain-containing protein [Kordiimonadaceae bacterium]
MNVIFKAAIAVSTALLIFTSAAYSKENIQVMVYADTGEGGWIHKSIPRGIETIRSIGKTQDWTVDVHYSENSFTRHTLSQYDVVVFMNTTADVLNDEQQAAFEQFIQAGGGYVGTHSASDTEYDWPWYAKLVGAYFENHPPGVHSAKVNMENTDHPVHNYVDETGVVVDEWYDFQANPRDSKNLTILMSIDESTYEGGGMCDDHPIAWAHEYDGGRAFYTGFGHLFQPDHPFLVKHLTGGIIWAAGADKNEVSLFDGKSLNGWHTQDNDLWSVKDGAITGGTMEDFVDHNTFLITDGSYKNFELKFKVRLQGNEGFVNSGFQIRSQSVPNDTEMSGYQVDAGDLWWGLLYDESRRNKVVGKSADMYGVDTAVKRGQWNEYRIIADGRRIRSWINGVPALDYLEADEGIPQDGHIGIQVHSGGKTIVNVKDISITELPNTPGLPTWEETGMPTGK